MGVKFIELQLSANKTLARNATVAESKLLGRKRHDSFD